VPSVDRSGVFGRAKKVYLPAATPPLMNGADLGERWRRVLDDTEATAAEYRDRGWEALACHPGDVNPVPDAARLDVLLPGPEFDEASELFAEAAVEAVQVYAAPGNGTALRLVVAESPAAERAVCVPAYLSDGDRRRFEPAVREAGQLTVRLRPLDDRDRVEFAVGEPDLFFRSHEE
jgi:hypothetical protein